MFNGDLFYGLCEKYGVELSDVYGKPVLQFGDAVREITEEDVRNMLPGFQEYFSYHLSGLMNKQIGIASYALDEFPIAC
jgi:hypothetical protein